MAGVFDDIFNVSIHAPVKGATLKMLGQVVGLDVSIHAPVKGATRARSLSSTASISFNSRSREGSDLTKTERNYGNDRVSIHAPVKGATAAPCRRFTG